MLIYQRLTFVAFYIYYAAPGGEPNIQYYRAAKNDEKCRYTGCYNKKQWVSAGHIISIQVRECVILTILG